MTVRRTFGNTLVALMSAATAALALSACGGGDGGGSPPPAPPPPPSATIGAAGGTVSGPQGAQVVIPAGALSANTAIAIAAAPSVLQLPAGNASVGPILSFTPHGQTFAQPVTITVPLNPAHVPAGTTVRLFKTMNGAAGPWQEVVNATRTGNLVTAQVTSFSDLVATISMTTPADQAVVAPSAATFTVNAIGGSPPYTYQWQKSDDSGVNWGPAPGAVNGPAYTTGPTSVAADNADRYRVLITSSDTDGNGVADGTATSRAATLTVTAAVVGPTITTQPQSVSVAVGGSATFSVVATGTDLVYQWQKNGTAIAGQTNASLTLANVQAADAATYTVLVSNLVNNIAINTVTSNAATLTVTTTPPPTTTARIAAGSDFSIAVQANGNVVSWGSDASGTLGAGFGDQTRNAPGAVVVSNVTKVYAGGAHGLALLSDGSYRGWGYNGFGQLADGSNLSRETPVNPPFNYVDAREACGGTLHSMVLRANGVVRAFGRNMNGQLGDGTNTDSTAAPYSVVVSGISTATAIACRGNHSLALLADGTVRAWGQNGSGQLGDGTTTDRNTPVVVTGLTNVIAIAAGSDHSLALRSDGSVWAWGSNLNGKLGDGTSTDRLTPVATLLTAGITAIAAGNQNSIALRGADGVVLSWGINETGQLGSGSSSPGFRATPAPVINLSGVVAIAFGSSELGHGLAVRSDGTVWAWGDNRMGTSINGTPIYGKLGNGSTVPFALTPVQVTGLNLN